MMVTVKLNSLVSSEAVALPFGYDLSFEANSIEQALEEIDKVTAWATPKVTEVSMEAGQSVEFGS